MLVEGSQINKPVSFQGFRCIILDWVNSHESLDNAGAVVFHSKSRLICILNYMLQDTYVNSLAGKLPFSDNNLELNNSLIIESCLVSTIIQVLTLNPKASTKHTIPFKFML